VRSPKTEEKVKVDRARQDILDAANNYLAGRPNTWRLLGRRHIQDAVCIVRRKLLLSDETLHAAGFNGVKVPRPRRSEPWGAP
jgi:hypothetical protein